MGLAQAKLASASAAAREAQTACRQIEGANQAAEERAAMLGAEVSQPEETGLGDTGMNTQIGTERERERMEALHWNE